MIKEELLKDLKQAMQDKNIIKKNTIQLIRAAILQKEKDELKALTDNEIFDLLISERKKRYNNLNQFEQGNRLDLVEQTKREIAYISKYLPSLLDKVDIEKKVISTIQELNASKKDMGVVIRKVKDDLKYQADGKVISEIVKNKLM